MMTAIILVLFVVVGVVAYIALRNAQDFSDANQIIPGVPTKAPKSWAGAHTPEARLHRRLRDAMAPLQSNVSLDDPAIVEVGAALQREALAVDERLIAVASLPRGQRGPRLEEVERAVHAIEEAVASVVLLRGPSLEDTEQGIEDARHRLLLVEAARQELEALAPGSPDLDVLRAKLEDTPAPAPEPEASPERDDQRDVE